MKGEGEAKSQGGKNFNIFFVETFYFSLKIWGGLGGWGGGG